MMDAIAFSIIVPTYERPDSLSACLRAIAELHYPRDRFEVIVVDDGSRTALGPIVDDVADRLDIRLLTQANAGAAQARNKGIAEAVGKYLAFTDDDCCPNPDWLDAFSRGIAEHPGAVLGGRTINSLTGNSFAEASETLIDYLHSRLNQHPQLAPIFPSNNLMIAAAVLGDTGGFDPSFTAAGGEDRELCERLFRLGYAFHRVDDAVVRHAHEMGLSGFLAQHWQYGIGTSHFLTLRPQSPGQGSRPTKLRGFYRRLVAYPFRRGQRRPLRLAAMLVISQLAHMAGFAYARWRAVFT